MCRFPIFREAAGGLVPCGQCFHCKVNKRQKKKSRLLLEAAMHDGRLISFFTLTYNNESLPFSIHHPDTGVVFEDPRGTLDPFEIQRFQKRLRQHVFRSHGLKIRIAVCGEYGSQTERPHYHGIVFGAGPHHLGPQSRSDFGPMLKSWKLCDPSILAREIQAPRSTADCAQYICSYLVKGSKERISKIPGARYPEFFRSSQGLARDAVPALASAMRTDSSWSHIWDNGRLPHQFTVNGKTYLLDDYMRRKILDHFGPAVSEELKKHGQALYEQEMQRLCAEAQIDPQTLHKRRSQDRLKEQFVAEKSAAMTLSEARFARFNPAKKGEI